MKFLIAILLTVPISVAGCRETRPESISGPVPGIEVHVHGYETADGTTVKYADVETGDKSSGGGGGNYDDRAVAR